MGEYGWHITVLTITAYLSDIWWGASSIPKMGYIIAVLQTVTWEGQLAGDKPPTVHADEKHTKDTLESAPKRPS